MRGARRPPIIPSDALDQVALHSTDVKNDTLDRPARRPSLLERNDLDRAARKPTLVAADDFEQRTGESTLVPPEYLEPPAREETRRIDRDEAAALVDHFLQCLAGREALCRLALGRIAARFLERSAHHRLGFARIGDYTQERLGVSARELQSAAQVARFVDEMPALGDAFESGRLNWTKLRLVGPVATTATAHAWIERAQACTSTELQRAIQRWKTRDRSTRTSLRSDGDQNTATERESGFDRRSAPKAAATNDSHADLAGDADDDFIDGEPRVVWTIRCPTRLRSLWREVRELASRSSGNLLAGWQALEAVAAEAMSGLGPERFAQTDLADETADTAVGSACGTTGANHASSFESSAKGSSLERRIEAARASDYGFALDGGRIGGEYTDRDLAFLRASLDPPPPPSSLRRGDLPTAGTGAGVSASVSKKPRPLDARSLADLDREQLDTAIADLSPQQLDARMRACLRDMQDIDWQMGCLLGTLARLRLYRHAGFLTLEHYVTERLGISARKARCLKQIEGDRTRGRSELAAAYRSGELSLSRALVLLPVLSELNAAAWIERACGVTLRRLTDEVNWARDMLDRTDACMEMDPPPLGIALDHSDAEAERQIRARFHPDVADRILRGTPTAQSRLRIAGPASVMALTQDVLRGYARPDEPPWQAFERMLLHAKEVWQAVPRHRNPIHERDGWRCRVPACSSRRNLQEHHIRFRSRGGGNERENRVSICAWHHLRGIHDGVVRAHGDAQDEIHWQLGATRQGGRTRPADDLTKPLMRLRNEVFVRA